MNSRQTWVIIAIVAVSLFCLCGLVAAILAGAGLFIQRTSITSPTEIVAITTAPSSAQTPQAPATTTETSVVVTETPSPTDPPGTPSIGSDISDQMDEIQSHVIAIRGLQPSGPVQRSLLTPEQLRERVEEDFFEDYTPEEARDDALVYSFLGLLPSNFDLFTFYVDLFSEQVAGYYDDEIKEMFIVQGESFEGPERITYAHEYVHALQDQVYDLRDGLNYNDETCDKNYEFCAALQALIEGDATVVEEQWLRNYATSEDLAQLFAFYNSFESPVLDAAPEFMQQDLIFPYIYGAEFIRAIQLDGGWAAVDAVYAEPPLSTEQILHPGRYPLDVPIVIPPPDLLASLGEGWREIDANVLGEWYTQLVLAEHIDEDLAARAAEGWGGDVYIAFHNEDLRSGAFVLITAWDRAADSQEFFTAFIEYGDERFGPGTTSAFNATWSSSEGSVLLERSGNQTLWILAPDGDTILKLREAINFPAQT